MAGAGLGQLISGIGSSLSVGAKNAVGLSIGSSSIKLVELKKAGKNWRLLHFGIAQLPEDVILNREIVNPVQIADSIRTLTSQIKLGTKEVCASLSGNALIIKKMTLEVPKLRELPAQVAWEAEQYLPFDISEVVMDFQIVSRKPDNKTDIILVAVKKSVLESYMECIKSAGLKPKVIDVDLFAIQNAYEANYPQPKDEAVCLVDIGASSLKVTIIQNGIPLFTKDSSIGGRNLTAEIQKSLNLNYADAETLKMGGQGGPLPQEISDLMHIVAENFSTEIKRAIDFYGASSTGGPVSAILIAGGSAKILGLSNVIEEATGIPTQLLNPFNVISYDPKIFAPDYLSAIGPIASIPIGLALRAGAK